MQPTLQDLIIGWAKERHGTMHVPFQRGKGQDGLHDRFEMRMVPCTECMDWHRAQPVVHASTDAASSSAQPPAAKRPRVEHQQQRQGGPRNGLEPKCIAALIQWYRLVGDWHGRRSYENCKAAMDNLCNARENIQKQVAKKQF
jgi:hypothetical protein